MGELEKIVAAVVRAQLGTVPERIQPIAGALGRRRFARVWIQKSATVGSGTLIARLEAPEDPQRRPAGTPPEPPLEPIRALLERTGLPVPRRLGFDARAGVELLEDLGHTSLADRVADADAGERAALYAEACSLVPRLQRIERSDGVAAFDRHLDQAQLAYKADRFARWSLDSANASIKRVVRDAFGHIAHEALAAPQRLAHRDFQSANLMIVEPDQDRARVTMIDLQGAMMAPPEYDLVCLLCDSYVDLDAAFVTDRIAAVRPQLPDAPDADTFAHRFDLLTLSRKGKDHALYRYAAAELGDPRYLRFLPAARRVLQAASARVAARDARFAELHELIAALAESTCAR